MGDTAKLEMEGKSIELPIVSGTQNEKAVDITKLRSETGFITLDSGFGNTGSVQSSITYIDGEKGVLKYRGIPIEELAEKSDFVETSYLLIYGRLPSAEELANFRKDLTYHSLIHEDMLRFYDGYPTRVHPMAILSSMVCSLSAYYPDSLDPNDMSQVDRIIPRLLSKLRTIAAYSYKKSIGQPVIYPRNSLSFCENFLYMMFAVPSESYHVDPEITKALNMLLILHADHEQNCSTSTVRVVGSSDANLFASISSGICALWGPKHGGANQAVIEMLQEIHANGGSAKAAIAAAKDKSNPFKLMGFGHRVYKNYDPRATVMQKTAHEVLEQLGITDDPLLDVARELERIALEDPYFIEKKLFPNVDFYSGIILEAMGFPISMFTPIFAVSRTIGWISQWKEMIADPQMKIGRPRQLYLGETARDYVDIENR